MLSGLENTKPPNMSNGQTRALTLALALIGRPKLVILNNPLIVNDPASKRKMIKTILDFTENSALLVTTGDVEVAELLSDKIAIMDEGKFIAIGSAGEIIQNHDMGYSVEIYVDLHAI